MYVIRFRIFFSIIALLFAGLTARLFQLQILEADRYKGISEGRRISSYPLEATRGTIFDRNGKILAMDQHAFDISVYYENLLYSYAAHRKFIPRISEMEVHRNTKKPCNECHKNKDQWLNQLSQLLAIPRVQLIDRAENVVQKIERLKHYIQERSGKEIRIKEETGYYPVISDVEWEKVALIEIQKGSFPGIRITPRKVRVYPGQEIASHILGYMNKLSEDEWERYNKEWNEYVLSSYNMINDRSSLLYDSYTKDDYIGRAGVEAQYEKELRGLRGKRFEEITNRGSRMEKIILERPPVPGNDLYLTIDSNIQAHAEKSLGVHTGAVVVMDPWTGEILAMASNPRFNPNTVNTEFGKLIKNKSKPFLNRAMQATLPPGSIFKVVTAVTALNEDYITADTGFTCYGNINYRDITFRCWSSLGHGLVTVDDAIAYSCNVFFFETAKLIGQDSLVTWAERFGFGKKTGIDLPYEKTGKLPEMNTVASVMNVAIGQGTLLTTPLQLVYAYSLIANGGTLVQPHILLKLTNDKGEVKKMFSPERYESIPIRPDVLKIVRTSLRDVVTRGTAQHTGLAAYKVAGKTGTAETGRHDENHAWFVGYAPYDNPRYCFAILVEHTEEHASDIACPIAKELLSHLFSEIDHTS